MLTSPRNSQEIEKLTKYRFMKSVCGICEKYSGSAFWFRWLCLRCLPSPASIFGGKNSFHEWKKLHFQEQSLTLMLTVTRHPQQGNN